MSAQPVVDVILSGGDPATHPRAEFLAQNAGLLHRDLDDIQSELLKCKCAKTALTLAVTAPSALRHPTLRFRSTASPPHLHRISIASPPHPPPLLHTLTLLPPLQLIRCAKKPLHFGEPYKALAANLSADDASLSRRDLTRRNGEGLLLREVRRCSAPTPPP